MICPPCVEGDHCNDAGCFCQHRPPGTGQSVCQYACLHPRIDHAPGRGCVHPGCPCLAGAQDAAPAPGVSQDPEPSARGPESRTADPDLYLSPGFNQVVKDVSTLALLADWMRAVRAGQRARAAVIHGALVARLGRSS